MTDSDRTIYREDLAYIHDVGFSDLARGAAPAILQTLRSKDIFDGTVVELGCGSGILLAALSDAGYQVIGLDSSAEMLKLAQKRLPGARLRCESLFGARIPPCRAVIAVGEPLNYESPGQSNLDLTPVLLGRVHDALIDPGLFLFDLILQVSETSADYQAWRAGEDWAVMVGVSRVDADRIDRRIIAFRKVGNDYRRSEETHRIRLFKREYIERLLSETGFSVEVRDGYGDKKLPPGRFVFEAWKGSLRGNARAGL